MIYVSGRNNCGQKLEEEENVSLAGKRRPKKGSSNGLTSKGEKKKKYLSKIKCYICHQPGHYVIQCPNKKKGEKKKHQ